MHEVGNCRGIVSPSFPGFPGTGNYHLTNDSVAIDAGVHAGWLQPALDLDHHVRVVGAAPDCGAYEHDALHADGFESGDGSWWAMSGG